jgi:hypothetical protein
VGGARLETRSGTGAVAATPIDFSSRGSGRGFFLGGYDSRNATGYRVFHIRSLEEDSMRTVFGFLAFFVSSVLLAQAVDIPVTNWTVPPWTGSSGGITTMTDFTPPRVFVAVEPCRVVDTRGPAGAYGGPALATNVARMFDIDSGPCPGLPFGIAAYSLNFGGILPPADGFLTAWPTGISQPVVSQLNLVGGEVVANAAIVPAGTDGSINVLVNIGPTNIYIDINGYFAETLGTPSNQFILRNDSTQITAEFVNTNPTCQDDCGVVARVYGPSSFAILGQTFGNGLNAAGVYGRAGVYVSNPPGGHSPAGVVGSSAIGVLGLSRAHGVMGDLYSESNVNLARGILGYEAGSATKYGVWAAANYGGSGAKFFVEPHPSDASRVIRYVSLEGPEAGTYFRGRGKFERGVARIPVPEDFRMVTDTEGLTVQITPIGGMASVGVLKIDLHEIVVQSSRNLEFSFMVNGVRRTHKHLTPIGEGNEYMPERSDSKMPAYLTDGQKELLVQNGTYRDDGTVNIETAQRLGWDRIWAERERPVPAPTP